VFAFGHLPGCEARSFQSAGVHGNRTPAASAGRHFSRLRYPKSEGATNAVSWTAFIVIARYPGVKGGFARALRRVVVDRGQSGNQRSAVFVRAWQ